MARVDSCGELGHRRLPARGSSRSGRDTRVNSLPYKGVSYFGNVTLLHDVKVASEVLNYIKSYTIQKMLSMRWYYVAWSTLIDRDIYECWLSMEMT